METDSSATANDSRSVVIAGTGCYLPKKVLTNKDLEAIVDTSDEWITTRTGIKERRIAADDEAASDLAARAGQRAIKQAGMTAEDIDLIIVATISPDMFFPSTACFVQRKIGAKNAVCYDISAACSGFLFAVNIAKRSLLAGDCKAALIIGAEKLSSMIDWTDRNTCVLFGDGAGAAVLKVSDDPNRRGIIATHQGSDGNQTGILSVPGGGSACPITEANVLEKLNTINMAGREVYKHAVTAMRRASETVLAKAGLTADDIAMIIPHQANLRIIEAITERLGTPKEKTYINLDKYGNTSAAAIAIALDEAVRNKLVKPGELVLLVVFGAGLTWASAVVEI